MMESRTRITSNQMRERMNQFRNEADGVNGIIYRMDSLIGLL